MLTDDARISSVAGADETIIDAAGLGQSEADSTRGTCATLVRPEKRRGQPLQVGGVDPDAPVLNAYNTGTWPLTTTSDATRANSRIVDQDPAQVIDALPHPEGGDIIVFTSGTTAIASFPRAVEAGG